MILKFNKKNYQKCLDDMTSYIINCKTCNNEDVTGYIEEYVKVCIAPDRTNSIEYWKKLVDTGIFHDSIGKPINFDIKKKQVEIATEY